MEIHCCFQISHTPCLNKLIGPANTVKQIQIVLSLGGVDWERTIVEVMSILMNNHSGEEYTRRQREMPYGQPDLPIFGHKEYAVLFVLSSYCFLRWLGIWDYLDNMNEAVTEMNDVKAKIRKTWMKKCTTHIQGPLIHTTHLLKNGKYKVPHWAIDVEWLVRKGEENESMWTECGE